MVLGGITKGITSGAKSANRNLAKNTSNNKNKDDKDSSSMLNKIILLFSIIFIPASLYVYARTTTTSRITSTTLLLSSLLIIGLSRSIISINKERNSKCSWDSEFKESSNCTHVESESEKTHYLIISLYTLFAGASIYKLYKQHKAPPKNLLSSRSFSGALQQVRQNMK